MVIPVRKLLSDILRVKFRDDVVNNVKPGLERMERVEVKTSICIFMLLNKIYV